MSGIPVEVISMAPVTLSGVCRTSTATGTGTCDYYDRMNWPMVVLSEVREAARYEPIRIRCRYCGCSVRYRDDGKCPNCGGPG